MKCKSERCRSPVACEGFGYCRELNEAKSFHDGKVILHAGDCMDVLKALPANSIDAIVTDPPYHLTSIVKRFGGKNAAPCKEGKTGAYARASRGFMNQTWDGGDIAFRPELWAEVLRCLKPGGHMVAFSGTRTYHRMVCAIEDAGFEVRDQLAWVYGCLDEETQVVTDDGVKPHHKTSVGDLVLCYDVTTSEYSYQPILEVVEYDFSDTAYRIIGDFGEQVVSRNHRCIVERGGVETFQLAEEAARQRTARVPVLEDLSKLQETLSGAIKRTGGAQQGMQSNLCRGAYLGGEGRKNDAARNAQGQGAGDLLGLRQDVLAECEVVGAGGHSNVLASMQWSDPRGRVETARPQGSGELEALIGDSANQENDRAVQPSLERRPYLSEAEGEIRRTADQVRSLSRSLHYDGAEGWLRDGASLNGGAGTASSAHQSGIRSSHQPRRDGQQDREPDAVRHERAAQGVRAWRGHHTTVVRIVPFHYVGKMWCLRVPTGAFVAVRRGVAFPTGNSGFPKSHHVSKGIDRAAGAEREVVGLSSRHMSKRGSRNFGDGASGFKSVEEGGNIITAPATDAARQWEGWGTSLKPAFEPICLCRKPLDSSTIAGNVLKWGTGALNIDGCRVPTCSNENLNGGRVSTMTEGWDRPWKHDEAAIAACRERGATSVAKAESLGRWPANLCLSWPADKYQLRPNVTQQEKRELYGWLSENA